LSGVGSKVADCICLMGLMKNKVVPVDTHVFQLTKEMYKPAFLDSTKKNISKEVNRRIGIFYFELFGEYAGWAQSVLFTARLLKATISRCILQYNMLTGYQNIKNLKSCFQ